MECTLELLLSFGAKDSKQQENAGFEKMVDRWWMSSKDSDALRDTAAAALMHWTPNNYQHQVRSTIGQAPSTKYHRLCSKNKSTKALVLIWAAMGPWSQTNFTLIGAATKLCSFENFFVCTRSLAISQKYAFSASSAIMAQLGLFLRFD